MTLTVNKTRRKKGKNENVKVSIDAFHNESEESSELKFQKKIIRCKIYKFLFIKNVFLIKDLETISKNFAKTVGMTFSKHNPYKFESWMISRLKYKVNKTLYLFLLGINLKITSKSIIFVY